MRTGWRIERRRRALLIDQAQKCGGHSQTLSAATIYSRLVASVWAAPSYGDGGTLILIALIVMIFAGRGNDDLQREIEGLRTEVVELRTSIASLEEAIERAQQAAPAEN